MSGLIFGSYVGISILFFGQISEMSWLIFWVKSRDPFLGKSYLHQLTQEGRGSKVGTVFWAKAACTNWHRKGGGTILSIKKNILKKIIIIWPPPPPPPQVMAKILYHPSYIEDLTQILNFDQNALIGVFDLINALTL